MDEPWREQSHYQEGPVVKCLGCGKRCRRTKWGNWCYSCNVERIERIDKAFNTIQRPE